MLKIIIVDDERFTRETLAHIINWEEYHIKVIGLCKNGLEAYDMILDESPDIVLTDIKMPGLDGLELIAKVHETGIKTQFILLSGYGEFEYAKKAMSYGIKYYLLKPCNEEQILESVQGVVRDCQELMDSQELTQNQFTVLSNLQHHVLFSMINDYVYQNYELSMAVSRYEPYMDFYDTPYQIIYIYYLEEKELSKFLEQLKKRTVKELSKMTIHGTYTVNTLTLFFQKTHGKSELFKLEIEQILKELNLDEKTDIRIEMYSSLLLLLQKLMPKIKRYSMIYYLNQFRTLSYCNYDYILRECDAACLQDDYFQTLKNLLAGINEPKFLKLMISYGLLKIPIHNEFSNTHLDQVLEELNGKNTIEELKEYVYRILENQSLRDSGRHTVSLITEQIFDYVETHISDQDLTLKNICEQYLFLNRNYVCKKFQKDTGIKFSAYLTNVRIEKAKEYLSCSHPEPIQTIADLVGCGKNPQYFSQLFKRKTGMSPSQYIAKNEQRDQ